MRVFVAGATGVLGRPLVRALVAEGHEVVGTTRSAERVPTIESDGGTGVVCDALDAAATTAAVAQAAPEVVVHQLTALPDTFGELRRGSPATNRLRREGTRNLVDAAVAAGARRVIAESIAFLYPPADPRGPQPSPATEDTAVVGGGPEPYASLIGALLELERAVTGTPGIEGVVLRYGTLYGPGTWYAPDGDMTSMIRKRRLPIVGSGAGITSFLHVDDAADATVRALEHGAPGVYNIVDDDPVTFAEHLPVLAGLLGAKPPRHVPVWLARPLAGAAGVSVLTAQRGATNQRAGQVLGWRPRHASWRTGFAAEYG